MHKTSHQTLSRTPHKSKDSSDGTTCQPQHRIKIAETSSKARSEQQPIAYLIIVLVIIWVIAALLTQNFFLLSGLPLLARELAYSLRRVIDILLPL